MCDLRTGKVMTRLTAAKIAIVCSVFLLTMGVTKPMEGDLILVGQLTRLGVEMLDGNYDLEIPLQACVPIAEEAVMAALSCPNMNNITVSQIRTEKGRLTSAPSRLSRPVGDNKSSTAVIGSGSCAYRMRASAAGAPLPDRHPSRP